MFRRLLPLVGLAFLTAGCSDMRVEDFAGKQPQFVFEDYFAGETKAWGIVRDRFGKVRRQFTVEMNGSWDGKVLTLDEHFVYDDGETDKRTWVVRKLDEHRYEGTAGDVIGSATGATYGNALNWSYTLALPIGERIWHVDFDDWMFLQPDGVLINRADMSKFGIRLGEIVLFFKKDVGAAAATEPVTNPAASGG
jgi:hypothetical protein